MPNSNEAPTDQVISMIQQGIPNADIIQKLQDQGYGYEQISEALTQAQTKASIEGEIPAPSQSATQQSQILKPSLLDEKVSQELQEQESPQFQPPQPQQIPSPQPRFQQFERDSTEQIEEIAESIIEEKWSKVIEDIGDLSLWKDKVKTEITSIKQEILRLESRFESMQKAVLGKIQDYDRGITDVGTEIKALEKLLQNIIKPLTQNVKDLSKVTERLKK